MNRPIYYTHSEYTSATQDACDVDWRATPLSFDASFLENPREYPTNLTLPETRVHKLYESYYNMDLSVFNFTQLISKSKKRCSRQALTCNPNVLWRLFSREPVRISKQTLYCQKLESLPKICATMCLSLFVLTQLFSKVGSQTKHFRISGRIFYRQDQSPWAIRRRRFRDPSLRRFDTVLACDRWTDGQPDRS